MLSLTSDSTVASRASRGHICLHLAKIEIKRIDPPKSVRPRLGLAHWFVNSISGPRWWLMGYSHKQGRKHFHQPHTQHLVYWHDGPQSLFFRKIVSNAAWLPAKGPARVDALTRFCHNLPVFGCRLVIISHPAHKVCQLRAPCSISD